MNWVKVFLISASILAGALMLSNQVQTQAVGAWIGVGASAGPGGYLGSGWAVNSYSGKMRLCIARTDASIQCIDEK